MTDGERERGGGIVKLRPCSYGPNAAGEETIQAFSEERTATERQITVSVNCKPYKSFLI